MWQVPVEEINRPGSFSSHARKNLELLVCVLAELKETQSLLQLAQLLKAKPDQNKQYLRDNERVAMHTKVGGCHAHQGRGTERPCTPRWGAGGGGVAMHTKVGGWGCHAHQGGGQRGAGLHAHQGEGGRD